MSIKTKIAALALATLAVAGSLATTTTTAEAYTIKPWQVGAGIATAAIVGTAIAANSGPVYYSDYRRCRWTASYNQFGQFMGNVRVCNYY